MSQAPPVPVDETARLQQLIDLDILDTLPEQAYDDLVMLASSITDCPISLVSLVADERQWFKARTGLDATETPRHVSFCAHAINEPDELFVVEDAMRDVRFAGNPLVTGEPGIRFYAGAPLTLSTGEAVGTLCVIDRQPRQLTDHEREALAALGRQVVAQLELRQLLLERETALQSSRRYQEILTAHRAELEESLLAEQLASMTDELTGVLNRRGLTVSGADLFERRRRLGRPLAALLLDIDRFKQFNDAHGHAAGDEALRTVAEVLSRTTRPEDVVARYGGEEFVVLVPTAIEEAVRLAERLRTAIAAEEVVGRPLTASIGAAAALVTHATVDELIADADEALYRAKDQGRDRVVLGVPD